MMSSSLGNVFFKWYWREAPRSILHGARNFLIWGANLFSLSLTIRTLFAPWRKTIHARRESGFDFADFFDAVLFTNFSRLIGFVVRSFILIFGLMFETVVLFFGIVIFLSWIILPLLIIALIFQTFS
jgi:hypothetical protein